ncbi:unnamed protein product, partial [marine sediment metagenome]
MALGLTFVLAMGEIDLSFPSVMALSGFIFTITFQTTNSVILALICSILSGVIVGFINGTLVTSIGIPSIVAQASEGPVVIYFFPGGAAGGTFATVVYNGAKAAEEILGDRVEVRYLWSGWSPQKMVDQFQQAVAANPDGIAIMGHPGDEAYKPFVEEAEKQGIIVSSQNTTLPELEKAYAANGFGYVGQGLYESGYTLGEATVKGAGLKAGDGVLVWGLLSQPTRGLRTK